MKDISATRPIIKELQRQLGCADLFPWLEDEAVKLARYSSQRNSFPINIQSNDLLRMRRVLTVQTIENLGHDAMIERFRSGYRVLVKRGLPRPRRRFAIAHELGHTYFFKSNGLSVCSIQSCEYQSIEELCDFFARSLLLPRTLFTSRLRDLGFDTADKTTPPPLHLTQQLAKEFDIAEQAVVRRLLFDIIGGIRATLCAKSVLSKKNMLDWKMMWCETKAHNALGKASGWRIPLNTNGRKIPIDMIPHVNAGETVETEIDGRWHKGVEPHPDAESRISLSRQEPLPLRRAWISRTVTAPGLFQEPHSEAESRIGLSRQELLGPSRLYLGIPDVSPET